MDTLQIIAISVSVLLVINVFLAGLMVFFERRNPASTWAWLLVLFFIPGLGFLIYLIFGKDSKRERMFAAKEKYDTQIFDEYIRKTKGKLIIEEQREAIQGRESITGFMYLDDIASLHLRTGNWLTGNNSVSRFIDGKSKFDSLIDDIRHAKSFIHMEYYILRGDNLGRKVVGELTKKAAEGVEVNLLYDGMGCSGLPKDFFDELQEAGGHAVAFLPPMIARINYRNHRKICVVDGEIGYIGGFNIGDEYLGAVRRYGPWRDTHLRITGDAVDQLEFRFLLDWNFTSKAKIGYNSRYFPEKLQYDGVKMQIVSSGPDTKWKNIRDGYFKMMNEAERNIYIETPYFVPDDSIFEALKVAALSGIDVRVVIPAHPDHFFVYWASMSYLGELLDVGVRCYQYEKGFIHSKAMFIDGIVSSVGTANMDIRSFDLNFEVNSFIYDRGVTEMLEADFLNDLKYCTEITPEWYRKRSAVFKIRESVSRLISPML